MDMADQDFEQLTLDLNGIGGLRSESTVVPSAQVSAANVHLLVTNDQKNLLLELRAKLLQTGVFVPKGN